jgi:hypothetical protein
VGNRLTQTTITNTTVYTYDIANRLVNVGGMAQTWDNNGNLLNDGVYTYTYRCICAVKQQVSELRQRLGSVLNQPPGLVVQPG